MSYKKAKQLSYAYYDRYVRNYYKTHKPLPRGMTAWHYRLHQMFPSLNKY